MMRTLTGESCVHCAGEVPPTKAVYSRASHSGRNFSAFPGEANQKQRSASRPAETRCLPLPPTKVSPTASQATCEVIVINQSYSQHVMVIISIFRLPSGTYRRPLQYGSAWCAAPRLTARRTSPQCHPQVRGLSHYCPAKSQMQSRVIL